MGKERQKRSGEGKNRLETAGIYVGIFFIFISIPVLLDRFLAHRGYMLWCQFMKVNSPMTEGEWFGFWGSYLGAVGTVMMGFIAYKQTKIINDQNESLSALQKTITDFQAHPIIQVNKTAIEILDGWQKPLLTAEELDNCYFLIYGRERKNNGTRGVRIRIFFRDRGLIPVTQYEVIGFKWKIADKSYEIQLNGVKQSSEAYNMVDILMDESDTVHILTDDGQMPEAMDAFFLDLDRHEHYENNGQVGYDTSILELVVTFYNQKQNQRSYILTYRIRSDSGKLMTDALILKSKEK